MSEIQHDTPPHAQVGETTSHDDPKKLSKFLVTNIVLISIVGGASILLLLFGDFEGKASRVISTLLIFALFTAFSSYDGMVDRPKRYLSISQIGNIYLLSLGLLFIWGTLGVDEYYDEFMMVPLTLLMAGIIKLGIMIVQKVTDFAVSDVKQLALAAKLAAISLALATVLFTLPIGLDSFFDFEETYWKITVAVLLFGALAISIMFLIARPFRDKAKGKKVAGHEESAGKESPVKAHHLEEPVVQPQASYEAPSMAPRRPESGSSETSGITRPVVVDNIVQHTGALVPGAPQLSPPPNVNVYDWPRFPNGWPVPTKENGRPDVDALADFVQSYVKAEKQWFG